MTINKLTDQRLNWLHNAATELAATNLKMTMKPEEVLWFTSELLEYRKAQNPVLFIDGDISPADAEKLMALLRECRGATPALMPGDPVLIPVQSQALRDVNAERQRQQSTKGYSVEQDDTYIGGELAAAAISYIEPMEAESYWPADWHDDSFKPSDYRRNLVKAGALILAEIERIDRQASQG